MNMKTIKEINEEIRKIQTETNKKIAELAKERDELIKKQDPIYLNPYIKYKDGKDEYLCKIIDVTYLVNGEIHYYKMKAITIKGKPYYTECIMTPSRLGDDWEFISEIEFEELLSKGLDLIRKDII